MGNQITPSHLFLSTGLRLMSPNFDLKDKLVEIQEKEITEYAVYKKLSEMSKGKNSEILKRISEDEHRHYNQWRKYTQIDVNVNRLSVIKYLIISKIFGLIFMMKLMEGNEEQTQATYSKILKDLSRRKTNFGRGN